MPRAHHTRRKRRQLRAALRNGTSAKPKHMLVAGRTGGVHAKKTPSKQRATYATQPARSIRESCTCKECGVRPGELHTQHGRRRA